MSVPLGAACISSLASVIESSTNLSFVTEALVILAVVTEVAPSLSVVTAPFWILAVATELSAGTCKSVAEPIWIINTSAPLGRLDPNIIVLASTIAYPSEGADVPVLAFCITPLTLTISCAALVTEAAVPPLLPSL